jgi:hypothetical protein
MSFDYSIVASIQDIYEKIVDKDYDSSINEIEELCKKLSNEGFLEELVTIIDNDILYKLKKPWYNVIRYPDIISRDIMLFLIKNPITFAIFRNTQLGKLRISGKEIASWTTIPNKRVISFMISDNDKTLSEQSKNGLFSCFNVINPDSDNPEERYNVKIFELSSNNKISIDEVITYCDAYSSCEDYASPLILVLNNNTQIQKLLKLLLHIKLYRKDTNLYIGGIWDEADKTYPLFRDKKFNIKIKGKIVETSFIDLLNDPDESKLFRVGFVTATEGDLLDDYDECATAELYKIEISPTDKDNYISIIHPDCVLHKITIDNKKSNNEIAEDILDSNWDEFKTPIKLKNGELYHRKIIINGDAQREKMESFANKNKKRAHVITFNMNGITVYVNDNIYNYKTKGISFNKKLFDIYTELNLNDKPTIITGRRKVDRGIGFHWAPRNGDNGLIWTDMIFGKKIIHIPSAVQKGGRLAGIIQQCPQYSGQIHYWGDESMMNDIINHYKKIETANSINYNSNSTINAGVAINRAVQMLPQRLHNTDESKYRVIKGEDINHTLKLTKEIIETIFGYKYREPTKDSSNDKYKTSLNAKGNIYTLIDVIKSIDGAYGYNKNKLGENIKNYRRFMPCYENIMDCDSLCCVIPLIDPSYTIDMKNKIDTEYHKYIKLVPQEN